MSAAYWSTSETSLNAFIEAEGLQDTICTSLDERHWSHWSPDQLTDSPYGANNYTYEPFSMCEDAVSDPAFHGHEADAEHQFGDHAQYRTNSYNQKSHDSKVPRTMPSVTSESTASTTSYSTSKPLLSVKTTPTRSQTLPENTTHKFECTYPYCDKPTFKALCDLKTHIRSTHSSTVLHSWDASKPSRCLWGCEPSVPGTSKCKSKAIFKTRRSLQAHLENVHVTPLVCTVSGCAYKGAFRSNYDLKRHVGTVHNGDGDWSCPYAGCGKGFVRKDKWLAHLKKCHEGEDGRCPLNHCGGNTFADHGESVNHIQKDHGKFECAIGACEGKAKSRFVEQELLRHLELHHTLSLADIEAARGAVKLSSTHTVTARILSSNCADCTHCFGNESFNNDINDYQPGRQLIKYSSIIKEVEIVDMS